MPFALCPLLFLNRLVLFHRPVPGSVCYASIDGDAFASLLISHQKGFPHLFPGGIPWKVDRFRHGIIGIF